MRLYIIRHGQTPLNRGTGKFQGRINSSLTKKGIKQAELIAKALGDKNISHIYCSPLKRATQSASIISRAINKKPIVSKELLELNFGILDGLSRSAAMKKYPDVVKKRDEDLFHYVIPNGESYEILQKRIKPFIKKLIARHRNENVAIVA